MALGDPTRFADGKGDTVDRDSDVDLDALLLAGGAYAPYRKALLANDRDVDGGLMEDDAVLGGLASLTIASRRSPNYDESAGLFDLSLSRRRTERDFVSLSTRASKSGSERIRSIWLHR